MSALPVNANAPGELREAMYNDDTPRSGVREWAHAGNDPAVARGAFGGWRFAPHPYGHVLWFGDLEESR